MIRHIIQPSDTGWDLVAHQAGTILSRRNYPTFEAAQAALGDQKDEVLIQKELTMAEKLIALCQRNGMTPAEAIGAMATATGYAIAQGTPKEAPLSRDGIMAIVNIMLMSMKQERKKIDEAGG